MDKVREKEGKECEIGKYNNRKQKKRKMNEKKEN